MSGPPDLLAMNGEVVRRLQALGRLAWVVTCGAFALGVWVATNTLRVSALQDEVIRFEAEYRARVAWDDKRSAAIDRIERMLQRLGDKLRMRFDDIPRRGNPLQ